MALLSLSCVKETSRGDNFSIEFQLNTPVFYDGDYISFTVKTNRSEVKVTEFSFPDAPEMVSVNSRYSVTDGYWTQRARAAVSATHRGRLSITFEDPVTGATRSFKEQYTAYSATGVRVSIENPVIQSANLRSRVSTVVGGDDFVFTIHSKSERLILKGFSCEFNDGQLRENREFTFPDSGELRITMEDVDVKEDRYNESSLLSLTFLNPETERDTTVTAEYVKVTQFKPTLTVTPTNIVDGDVVTLRFGGNRSPYTVTSLSAPSWFSYDGVFGYGNYSVALGADGTKTVETEPVSIAADSSGDLVFELEDTGYTNRKTTIRVPYKASALQDPKTVVVDKSSATVNSDETLVVKVSTNDTYSTNTFHAAMSSADNEGKILFYAPSANETTDPRDIASDKFAKEVDIKAGLVYMRSCGEAGQFPVKISAKNRTNVYKTVNVKVRKDVVLVLKADCYNHMTTDGGYVSDNSHWHGWYGMPKSITAEVMEYRFVSSEYNNTITGISRNNVNRYLTFSELSSSVMGITVKVSVNVQSKATSKFFKKYCTFDSLYDDCRNLPEYTLPEKNTTEFSSVTSKTPSVSLTQLCTFMAEMDCQVRAQENEGWGSWHWDDHLDQAAKFGAITFSVDSFSHTNGDDYRVRYLINTTILPGFNAVNPWWMDNVAGDYSWITML